MLSALGARSLTAIFFLGTIAFVGPQADFLLSEIPEPKRSLNRGSRPLIQEPVSSLHRLPASGRSIAALTPAVDLHALVLQGLINDENGNSVAILAGEGVAPMMVKAGAEIGAGISLVSIGTDHAIVSRNGFTRRLSLGFSSSRFANLTGAERSIGQPIVRPVTPPDLAPVLPAVRASVADVDYRPQVSGTRVSGLVVQPHGSGAALGHMGLAPGDVVVSVEGQSIGTAEQAVRASRALRRGGVSVKIERSGVASEFRLPANPRLD